MPEQLWSTIHWVAIIFAIGYWLRQITRQIVQAITNNVEQTHKHKVVLSKNIMNELYIIVMATSKQFIQAREVKAENIKKTIEAVRAAVERLTDDFLTDKGDLEKS